MSMVLTLDDWAPSYDTASRSRRDTFSVTTEPCDCNDCVLGTFNAVTDWWCGGFVRCTLYTGAAGVRSGFHARVAFWGADDTGMERDFEYEEDARRFVCHLPVFVTKQWLDCVGFRYA